MRAPIWIAGSLVVVLGCGSDADTGTSRSTCEQLAERVCPEACECAECWLRATSDSVDVHRIRFGERCVQGFVSEVCADQSKPAALFEACLGRLQSDPSSAACMPEDNDVYYFLPPECHNLFD